VCGGAARSGTSGPTPTKLSYDGATVHVGLSRTGLEDWAGTHADLVVCDFPYQGQVQVMLPCGNGPRQPSGPPLEQGPSGVPVRATPAMIEAQARRIALQDCSNYAWRFLYPSVGLMVDSGLWIELEAAIGFVVGLGLGSLLGQRTVGVILLIVLEVVLTPATSFPIS